MTDDLSAARQGDEDAFARLLDPYRRELRAHCYRMSGSLHDADDLLQESLIRVWRGLGSYQGRAGLRTWLYKVTTNVCLDALDARGARTLPAELDASVHDPLFLEPCPEELYTGGPSSPEARYGRRESVALAFLVALQILPPRQRAILVLRDVLGLEASECGELLELSVAAVNSALQRARETLELRARPEPEPLGDEATRALLAKYVEAWELADVGKLVALLHDDALLSMPPMRECVRGPVAIGASIRAMVLTPEARGTFRLVPTRANALPAFAAYLRDPGGAFMPRAIHLLEVRGGRIAAITAFIDPALFAPFGLPAQVD